ncbi:MAG: hypothetical protein CM15mP23_20220 [Cryomorphaceae bacterium]|nr:MAG: hypothetical protein CM15mP23_20220 [Cryomorphaceae bacterium]
MVKNTTKLLNEITISPLQLSHQERISYFRLQKKVNKVYPYAQKAKIQLREIENDLMYADTKKEKRRISKLHERWLREHFTEDLKKLRRSEGRILIKLIHYETGMSSYDLIKEYRNGLTALLWQKLAKLYDGNLKTTYKPEDVKEDQWISHILRQIEVHDTFKKDD